MLMNKKVFTRTLVFMALGFQMARIPLTAFSPAIMGYYTALGVGMYFLYCSISDAWTE